MNESIKNIFSFIKEALELRNKNIYDVNNYPTYIDLGSFYNKYKSLIGEEDYKNIDIYSEKTILKLKYISENNKKQYPSIPKELKEYIYLNEDNDIIDKVDNLEEILNFDKELFKVYNEYSKEVKTIDNYNELINKYNEIYNDLYTTYKAITDSEEKIEVILGTNLLVWKDKENSFIMRHPLEANLDITIDPNNNAISLSINEDKFKGLVMDFLNLETFKVKNYSLLSDLVKHFNNDEHEEEIDIKNIIKQYMNYASIENQIIDGEYISKEDIKPHCLYSFNNIGIIVRNKNTKLWVEDLEKIILASENTKFTSPIINLFEVNFEDEMQVKEMLEDKTYEDTKDEQVLFPLPSNEEQYKIVDKVRSSNITLVQGPPGTGKSHTIANLISHYVSKGMKVIVTSEKAKALEVLRNKIPEEIRNLSLSLLTMNGIDKDLEFSVSAILKNQIDDQQQRKVEKNIEELTNNLEKIYESKRLVQKEIIDLMLKDTVSYKEELNGLFNFSETNKLTLMELAIWLSSNKKYDVISLNDVENYNYTNLSDFFIKLDNITDKIKENRYALNMVVPVNNLLETNELELAVNESIKFKNYEPKYRELIKSIRQGNINLERLNKLKEEIKKLIPLYNIFDKKYLSENSDYEVFRNQISKIKDSITKQYQYIINVEEKMLDYDINYQKENLNKYHETLKTIISLYNEDGSISLINKLKLSKYLKELNGLIINSASLAKDNISKDLVSIIAQRLYYDKLVREFERNLQKVLNCNIFEILNVNKEQFGKYANSIIEILSNILDFKKLTSNVESQFNYMVNTNLFEINYINRSEEEINDILQDMNYYLEVNLKNNRTHTYAKELKDFYKEYNLQNLNGLLNAIEENNETNLIYYKNKLLDEINIINNYNTLKNNHNQFMNDKQRLINDYIYNYSNEEKFFLKENINSILKYHYINKFYKNLELKESELPRLYLKREELVRKEKEVIKSLIATKGWYYQSKYMTPSISFSLSKWIQLKRKRGAGTGKNAQVLLRRMREEMMVAKNAIPVWIMPIDKLIEQYPFDNNPPFDILIMDESSQSSIYSVSALARAKKIIIVGDDKQISPTDSFQNIDDINNLRTKYLKNNPWDLQIQRDTSIYDLVQTVCGNKKITLTEHFRCLPEIIHYSNKEFYNMEINPLKVRGINETIKKPIEEIYVPDAYLIKSGNQYYNDKEILKIVSLIEDMANNKEYDNKTIGVISLMTGAKKHIQKLTELIMAKFGEKFIRERKIKIGTTYDFQGDERDVIILSMLVSPVMKNGEKYTFRPLTKKEYNKSFNVAASRAKEQMILVHSVKLEELNPICNRYKLLQYCMTYDGEKEKEVEKLFESNFERDVYYLLTSKGFKLTPQFKVGNYRLDFVVENGNNQKIVIECDGDSYHGINELESDLERQTVLERCGWNFIRVRASEFYYEKEKATNRIIGELNRFLDNHVVTESPKETQEIEELVEEPKEEQIDDEDILSSILATSKDDMITLEEIEKSSSVDIDKIGPSQFKYMVLFSEGVSKTEIADYYKVTYDSVKKALRIFSKKYNKDTAEECKDLFKNECSNTVTYQNIINYYKNKK